MPPSASPGTSRTLSPIPKPYAAPISAPRPQISTRSRPPPPPPRTLCDPRSHSPKTRPRPHPRMSHRPVPLPGPPEAPFPASGDEYVHIYSYIWTYPGGGGLMGGPGQRPSTRPPRTIRPPMAPLRSLTRGRGRPGRTGGGPGWWRACYLSGARGREGNLVSGYLIKNAGNQ